jgi:hypothetical protein
VLKPVQEGFDDLRRFQSDREANERRFSVVRAGELVQVSQRLYSRSVSLSSLFGPSLWVLRSPTASRFPSLSSPRTDALSLLQLPSKEIAVGDVIFVAEDTDIPCDMMLLCSSDRGQAYIQVREPASCPSVGCRCGLCICLSVSVWPRFMRLQPLVVSLLRLARLRMSMARVI